MLITITIFVCTMTHFIHYEKIKTCIFHLCFYYRKVTRFYRRKKKNVLNGDFGKTKCRNMYIFSEVCNIHIVQNMTIL